MLVRWNGYELDDDRARVDRDALWAFLSHDAYWARWRTRDIVDQQVVNAWRVVGAYETATGRMVGFARAISDGVAYAYLADVYVLADARSRGLGRQLVEIMIEGGTGAAFRWCLHTADAHSLYAKFGFAPPDHTYLERPSRQSSEADPPAEAGPPAKKDVPTHARGNHRR